MSLYSLGPYEDFATAHGSSFRGALAKANGTGDLADDTMAIKVVRSFALGVLFSAAKPLEVAGDALEQVLFA